MTVPASTRWSRVYQGCLDIGAENVSLLGLQTPMCPASCQLADQALHSAVAYSAVGRRGLLGPAFELGLTPGCPPEQDREDRVDRRDHCDHRAAVLVQDAQPRPGHAARNCSTGAPPARDQLRSKGFPPVGGGTRQHRPEKARTPGGFRPPSSPRRHPRRARGRCAPGHSAAACWTRRPRSVLRSAGYSSGCT